MTKSPFDWNTGEPSIFAAKGPQQKEFNRTNANRSIAQTRLEPRPSYLVSDSVYLAQPKPLRRFK